MPARSRAFILRVAAVGGVVLLGAGILVGTPSYADVADLTGVTAGRATQCNGRVATGIGEPGATMVGTPGDDVFVTRGASRVDTGAGNDSICVTGRGPVVINAGTGDDFVGARRHIGKTFVSLGFGNDVFLGGPGADRVWSQESANQTATDDRDEIYAGRGNDYVISGSSSAPNNDRVNLGPGNDVLVTYGFAGDAVLRGGSGTNTYQPLPGASVSGDWSFDNVRGRATLDGVRQLVWTSFHRFELRELHGPRIRFYGSRAGERVTAGGACRVVLRGRGGNDRLIVGRDGCNNLPAGDALLLGGPGRDFLYGSAGDDVLRGGKGRDRANGGPGSDRCFAEIRVDC